MEGLSLSVAPNPSEGQFSVLLPQIKEEVHLSLIDLSGWVLESKTLRPGQRSASFDLTGMAKGLYFIRAYTESGQEGSSRIITR